jgi:hypothetical protein
MPRQFVKLGSSLYQVYSGVTGEWDLIGYVRKRNGKWEFRKEFGYWNDSLTFDTRTDATLYMEGLYK